MPDNTWGYLLSPRAQLDLEDIWLYTFKTWSLDQADHYHSTIIATIEGLASGEKIGRDASDIHKGYRKVGVGRHELFYRESEVSIAIIRILHLSMDVIAHLGTGDA